MHVGLEDPRDEHQVQEPLQGLHVGLGHDLEIDYALQILVFYLGFDLQDGFVGSFEQLAFGQVTVELSHDFFEFAQALGFRVVNDVFDALDPRISEFFR